MNAEGFHFFFFFFSVFRQLMFLASNSVSQKGDWAAEKVIKVPSKKVEGWALPEMPGECF